MRGIAALAFIALAVPAFAALTPTVSGRQMRDFTRITFNWPQNVRFRVQPTANGAVLTFSQPAQIDLGAIRSAMGGTLKGASASADGSQLTLTFDRPYRVRHFISGNANGIDVLGATQTAQAATPPPATATDAPPPPAVVKPPVKPAVAPPSAPAARPAAEAAKPKPSAATPPAAKPAEKKPADQPTVAKQAEPSAPPPAPVAATRPAEQPAADAAPAAAASAPAAEPAATSVAPNPPAPVAEAQPTAPQPATMPAMAPAPPVASPVTPPEAPTVAPGAPESATSAPAQAEAAPPPAIEAQPATEAQPAAQPTAPAAPAAEAPLAAEAVDAPVAEQPSSVPPAPPAATAAEPASPAAESTPATVAQQTEPAEPAPAEPKAAESASAPAQADPFAPPATHETAAPSDPAEAAAAEAKAALTEEAEPEPAPPAQAETTTPTGPFIVTSNVLPTGTEIRFPWRTRTAAAVFMRGSTLWVVFNQPFEVKKELLKSIMPAAVESVDVVEHPGHTILRLKTDGSVYAKITRPRGTLEWWVTLSGYRQLPRQLVPISPNTDARTPSLNIPILEYAPPITLTDPVVGDELVIAPLYTVGEGVYPARDYAELSLLETAQGMALVRKADLATIRPLRNGMKVTAKAGVSLSRNLPQLALDELESMANESVVWFPYDSWKADDGQFNTKRQELEKELIGATDIRANSLRLKLAQLYLSEGLAYETLGWLEIIRAVDPNFYAERQLASMRGAANFLIDRFDVAAADFRSVELNERPEQTLWLDALKILQEDKPRFNYVEQYPAFISKYPPALREKLAILAADNYINRRSFAKALATFDTLSESGISPRLMPYIDFLLGKISAESKKYKTAAKFWEPLTQQLDDRFIRARAEFALTTLRYTRGEMDIKEAINRLDRLRVVWRGDSLELSLLNYLGQLYIKDGNYLEGLRALKELKNNFPTSPILPDVALLMATTFKKLFAENEADKLEPLQALSIFYEFRDLVPIGDEGDAMIQGLATRLAGVDLLDKAAGLLEHQIKFRQEKLARSKLGAQLAMIYLMNRLPEKALNTLELTGYGTMPADLAAERTRLAANALKETGKPEKAIEMLEPDPSRQADLLRLDIFWHMRQWPEVIQMAEALLSARTDQTAPLTDTETEQLLQLAIAYMFERDTSQLNYLRSFYAPLLGASPQRDIFMYVTDASGPIDPKKISDVSSQISRIEGFMRTYREQVGAPAPEEAVPPAATVN